MTDPMANRFQKNLDKQRLDDFSKRTRSKEDIEAEERLLKETKKVEPIKSDAQAGRNDPCPCGSGKKFKKCCAKEK